VSAGLLLRRPLRRLPADGPVRFALGDTPARRHGPHVPGASMHRNPTPGPADQRFLDGHAGVTRAGAVARPLWGAIGLPPRARLYVRKKGVPRVPARQRRPPRIERELAAEPLTGAAAWVRSAGRPRRGRWLLRQAAVPARRGAAARPPAYGPGRISPAERAGQHRGRRGVPARQCGASRVKRVTASEAARRPAGGRTRVVLLREAHGRPALLGADPSRTARQTPTAAAGRFAAEQAPTT
jgi:hypothetical protein